MLWCLSLCLFTRTTLSSRKLPCSITAPQTLRRSLQQTPSRQRTPSSHSLVRITFLSVCIKVITALHNWSCYFWDLHLTVAHSGQTCYNSRTRCGYRKNAGIETMQSQKHKHKSKYTAKSYLIIKCTENTCKRLHVFSWLVSLLCAAHVIIKFVLLFIPCTFLCMPNDPPFLYCLYMQPFGPSRPLYHLDL